MTRWALVCVLVIADLVTKTIADHVEFGGLIDPTVNDELMLGVAGASMVVVVALSMVVCAFGHYATSRLAASGYLAWWVGPVGLAGLIGNLVDRLSLGLVRDWVVVGSMRWNLADVFLLAAVVLTVAAGIRSVLDEPTIEGGEVTR